VTTSLQAFKQSSTTSRLNGGLPSSKVKSASKPLTAKKRSVHQFGEALVCCSLGASALPSETQSLLAEQAESVSAGS